MNVKNISIQKFCMNIYEKINVILYDHKAQCKIQIVLLPYSYGKISYEMKCGIQKNKCILKT